MCLGNGRALLRRTGCKGCPTHPTDNNAILACRAFDPLATHKHTVGAGDHVLGDDVHRKCGAKNRDQERLLLGDVEVGVFSAKFVAFDCSSENK